MKSLSLSLSVTALAAALLAPSIASAATVERVFSTNPAGVCQGALPVFDGLIRKRPKAVANEGSSNAFVTCSFTSQGPDGFGDDSRNPIELTVYVSSLSGAPQNVTCTAVPGWDAYTGTGSAGVTKTVSAGAPSAFSSISWLPTDFAAGRTVLPTSLISISCSLPPNTAINDSYIYFNEEIGQTTAPTR